MSEVVLKLPLHCAGKNTTVGRALPNKVKKLMINLFISSPCCTIYKKCARCKGVPLSPLHFCLLTGISAKHFIAVIDMGHTNTEYYVLKMCVFWFIFYWAMRKNLEICHHNLASAKGKSKLRYFGWFTLFPSPMDSPVGIRQLYTNFLNLGISMLPYHRFIDGLG